MPPPAARVPGHAESLDAREIAAVLARHDLGRVDSIRAMPGGASCPTMRITAERGRFVLKRRADLIEHALAIHALSARLIERGFPTPRFVPDRDGSTLVCIHTRLYELAEFIPGGRADGSPESLRRAGIALARFHELAGGFEGPLPRRTYHRARGMIERFDRLAARLGADAADAIRALHARVGDEAERAGFDALSRAPGVIHGDWHPGNLVYENGHVSAVLDLDGAARAPRVLDLAQALIHVALMPPDPARGWTGIELERVRALASGIAEVRPIQPEETPAIPWLMAEAMLVEAAAAVAATGRFRELPGPRFLAMVERQGRWIIEHRGRIENAIRDGESRP